MLQVNDPFEQLVEEMKRIHEDLQDEIKRSQDTMKCVFSNAVFYCA